MIQTNKFKRHSSNACTGIIGLPSLWSSILDHASTNHTVLKLLVNSTPWLNMERARKELMCWWMSMAFEQCYGGVRNGGLEVMKTASMDLTQLKVRPYWGTGSRLQIMKIVDNVLKISITQLSEYRYDGHTTIYGESKGKLVTKEQRSDPREIADCIHWLLPGVIDT
ncbi:hypothetical protein D5086_021789 [Populus alba]|uniref:Uncharacterized protein n=1 Tax=Populus alba TaxID=43335 RepID=A0ACC4BDQ3_POPAL